MDLGNGRPSSNGDLHAGTSLDSEIRGQVTAGEETEDSMKFRILKTAAVYLSLIGLGFSNSILGLSFVHMEYIFHTNTQTLSFAFTVGAIGFTLGGVLCGLVYDRSNKEFAFSLAVIMASIAVIAAGFSSHVATFMAMALLQGMAMGFIIGAAQSYCVNLWKNHKLKEPVFQALHALCSLAATIGPFIIRRFLIELASSTSSGSLRNETLECTNLTHTSNDTLGLENKTLVDVVSEGPLCLSSMQPATKSSSLAEEELVGIEMARYAYLTVGTVVFCSGILFFVLYFYRCSPLLLKKPQRGSVDQNKSHGAKTHKQKERFLLLVFLFILFLFNFFYSEGIPLAYFTAFVIKHLGWSVNRATVIMPVLYGMQCFGRVLGIPLSTVIKPRTMLIINLLITAVAYILLLFVNVFDEIMWVSAILSGYGMSSTIAAMVLWISEYVPITGRVAAILIVGGASGGMTGPLIVGQLFDAVTPMWMVYILIISSLLQAALFGLLLLFVRKNKNFLTKNLPPAEEHEKTNLSDKSNAELDVMKVKSDHTEESEEKEQKEQKEEDLSNS